jgi:5-methyltetrahydropteroyltriglutamate--homocysteine methyltransferase
METLVDDVGSFPLPKQIKRDAYARAYEGARKAIRNHQNPQDDPFIRENFYDVVVEAFKIKLSTGLDVINFPSIFSGLRQVGDAIRGAMETGSFIVDPDEAFLPEIYPISQEAKQLSEEYGKKIQLRVCMFGPIEQYLNIVGAAAYPDVLDGFAETLNRFAKNSILNNKYIETAVVSIDEPSLGHSSFQGSSELIVQTLKKAYDFVGPTKQVHLHFSSPVHDLLAVEGLDVLSFEYAASPKNINDVPKSVLDAADKRIRVGVTRTDIDSIWAELYEKGITQPTTEQLIDDSKTIQARYRFVKEKYGDALAFTGPDCGLGSWPSPDAAEQLLRRTVHAIKTA